MRFNEVTQQLSEDFDPIKRQHLDDLISQYRDATDPIGYDDDAPDPDEVIAQIRQEFGDKIANDLEQGPSSHFPRDNHSMGYDSLKHSGSPRVTKSGKVNRQDVSALKGRLQQRAGSHTQPKLPEGMDKGSQRVDSLVTDALKIMKGAELSDAVQALKTVLGNREYNDRRGHYSFYVRQLMDMYSQQGVTEGVAEDTDEKKSFKVTYTNPKTEENKVVKIKAHNKDEVLDYCVSKGYNDVSVKEMASEGYRVVPGFDKEKYQERPGLEGPFHTKSGKVVYYDKKEGSYYDPDTDMYISYEDWNAMNEGWKDKLAAGALAATMALGAAGAQARVTPGDDPSINRLTGKPVATQPAASAAPARIDSPTGPSGFSKEYLKKASDPNRLGRFMISVEKAQELLKQMGESVSEAGLNRRPSGRASWDSNMPGYQGDYGGADNWSRREREDDEHHEIDRRQEQQSLSGTWYITIDGKLAKDEEGQLYQFVGKAAATKAARAMMAEPLHQGKKFMLTTKGA